MLRAEAGRGGSPWFGTCVAAPRDAASCRFMIENDIKIRTLLELSSTPRRPHVQNTVDGSRCSVTIVAPACSTSRGALPILRGNLLGMWIAFRLSEAKSTSSR